MKNVNRLLEDFRPQHYTLELTPDPQNLEFTGHVLVEGEVIKATPAITLHANGLVIESAKIDNKIATSKHTAATDELTIECGQQLAKGVHRLEITFSGAITQAMVGLYPCNFTYGGQEKRLIATQFESHHAREVFPCIDEPAAKATFDLTLYTPSGDHQVVLSNTPIKQQAVDGGMLKTEFETTPKMSTYLLAFVFGEMKSLQAKTKSGTIVKTWATPDNVESTRFALEVAVKCLDFYNEYFETAYPLAKCDMVALPDFAAGAMENWGLITYRESAMFVDKQTTTLPSKQWVALVVAHELAHQWFGNLVTMEWWTDLWLNEGFASWVEYLSVDRIFPEWQMWTEFVADDFMRGQALDSLASSHPIEIDVPDPDEIRNIFDAISYSKGACVIRMLDAYLGSEDFRAGLAHYLREHAYGNACTADLWVALETASSKPVRKFMSAWTTQTGFPLVQASSHDGVLTLEQERYLINPARRETADDSLWPVPVSATHTREVMTLDGRQGTWDLASPDHPKLNRSQTGFFVVAYDDAWQAALSQDLAAKELEPVERLGLLNDSFQLAKAGYAATTRALRLLDDCTTEDHPAVWDVIVSQLASIRAVMDDDELVESMRPQLRQLSARQVERLGWDERPKESHFDSLLRPLVLSTASLSQQAEVVNEALRRFEAAKTPEELPANIRGTILATVARDGQRANYERLLDWHNQTHDAHLKSSLAGGLGSFRDKASIDQSLELINSKHVRLQEVVHWVSFMFSNRKAKAAAWEWLTNSWDWLKEQFGTDIMTFMYFPRIAGGAFSEQSFIKTYDEFFAAVDTKGIQRAVDQGRESIEWQAAWKTRDQQPIKDFYNSWNG